MSSKTIVRSSSEDECEEEYPILSEAEERKQAEKDFYNSEVEVLRRRADSMPDDEDEEEDEEEFARTLDPKIESILKAIENLSAKVEEANINQKEYQLMYEE
jgi:hypothetical protein